MNEPFTSLKHVVAVEAHSTNREATGFYKGDDRLIVHFEKPLTTQMITMPDPEDARLNSLYIQDRFLLAFRKGACAASRPIRIGQAIQRGLQRVMC